MVAPEMVSMAPVRDRTLPPGPVAVWLASSSPEAIRLPPDMDRAAAWLLTWLPMIVTPVSCSFTTSVVLMAVLLQPLMVSWFRVSTSGPLALKAPPVVPQLMATPGAPVMVTGLVLLGMATGPPVRVKLAVTCMSGEPPEGALSADISPASLLTAMGAAAEPWQHTMAINMAIVIRSMLRSWDPCVLRRRILKESLLDDVLVADE